MTEYELPCYFGFCVEDMPLSTMKDSLSKLILNDTINLHAIEGVYVNDSDEKHLVIAIPNIYDLFQVTSTGFQVPIKGPILDTSLTTEDGEIVRYKIYYSFSRINPGPMRIVCNISL